MLRESSLFVLFLCLTSSSLVSSLLMFRVKYYNNWIHILVCSADIFNWFWSDLKYESKSFAFILRHLFWFGFTSTFLSWFFAFLHISVQCLHCMASLIWLPIFRLSCFLKALTIVFIFFLNCLVFFFPFSNRFCLFLSCRCRFKSGLFYHGKIFFPAR